jgi:K(+)-stimulated pyrophosphate-energized sodium pump
MFKIKFLLVAAFLCSVNVFAGDADIQLPALDQVNFFHGAVTSRAILFFGLFVCAVGAAFGL